VKFILKLFLVVVALSTMGNAIYAGTLRIGVKEDVPYFGYYNAEGKRAGIDVDLGKAIAAHLGQSPVFFSVSSKDRIPFLEQNKLDLVIATFSITSERLKHVQFSSPYYIDGQRVMVKADSAIHSLVDLSGKKVGVVAGATSGERLAKEQPKATIINYNSYYEAYMDLLFGQVDAISSDGAVIKGLQAVGEGAATELKQRKNQPPVFYLSLKGYKLGNRFRLLDDVLSKERYGIATARKDGNNTLLSSVNHYLNSRDGKKKLSEIIAANMGGRE